MPIATIQTPDGGKMRIEVPEGATQKQIIEFAEQNYRPRSAAPIDTAQAGIEATTRGATLGASDFATPAIGALYAKLFGGEATEDISLAELFEQGRQDVSGRREQFREESPILSTGLEIAGSLPTGGTLFKGATAGAAALGAGTKLAPLAGLSATGAVEGFGLADGDLGERAESAAVGALMAPATAKIFQKAGPMTIKAVRKFSEATTDPVKAVLGSVFDVNPVAAREFMREGVPLSALNVSQNPVVQRMGSILRGTMGSTRAIERNVEDTLSAFQKRLGTRAFTTGRQVTKQEAGEVAQRGIENHIDKFQRVSSKLYGRVGKFLSDGDVSPLKNTRDFVRQEMAQFSNEPNLLKSISGSKAMREAVNAIEDAGESGLRYPALRRYRTEIGSLIKQNVISGEDNALAKRVYASLTNDMEDLARSKGPKALRAFNNANAFYKTGLEQIESRLKRYIGTNADPGQLINTLQTSSKNSDVKIKAVMRAVSAQDRPVIRDAVLQRMGKNTKNEFSLTKFFKDYDQISKEAKSSLFGNQDQGFRQSLDRLSRIARTLSESGRFENYSRSADNMGNMGLLALGYFSPSTAVQTAVGSNLSARLLTNRSFAKVLAKNANKKIQRSNFSRMLKDLEGVAIENPSLENDIASYIGLLGASAATIAGEEE